MGRLNRLALVILVALAIADDASCQEALSASGRNADPLGSQVRSQGFTGSGSCRPCHERFYQLWATSYHGLAMQPYTAELVGSGLTPQHREIAVGGYQYRADVSGPDGWVRERGPEGEKNYRIEHVLGGKNVYYFLTSLDRGRMQVLPVAYDLRRKEWFDMAESGVRHFPDRTDAPIGWKEYAYTFNTSCFSCHVSQLSTNYDLESDSYRTVWLEPGINCETCHGPAEEHIRVCREALEGRVPEDLEIIRMSEFTPEQTNATCAPCHAKMRPLTSTFVPGDRYFDHFDLTTLEHLDFYPDGRDLGENYTFTLWQMSPCARAGDLDCLHCHTSSGRYRFKEDDANSACMPCHEARVRNATAHTHHPERSEGSNCIACHMPMTEFARMRRSDHSMLPPAPAATMAFSSPNACNLCHMDQDAAWADRWIREWHADDYQAPILHRAGLVKAARNRDWSRLTEMLDYIARKDRDEVFATSLIRLLEGCEDDAKWPTIVAALEDPSPLVRAAAANALAVHLTPDTLPALLRAAGDEYGIVRIDAAYAIASYPRERLDPPDQGKVERASNEYLASLLARPDDWASHYNLGNYYSSRQQLEGALAAYETALKLDPRRLPPLVNGAMVYARLGQNAKAEQWLRRALEIEPGSPEASFNLGLLMAEEGSIQEAEQLLRSAFDADPTLERAAYNLAVLLAPDRLEEALHWCRQAVRLRPKDPEYAYTLAYFLRRKGDARGAARLLEEVIARRPAPAEAYMLLGTVYEEEGRLDLAGEVYRKALQNNDLPEAARRLASERLQGLRAR